MVRRTVAEAVAVMAGRVIAGSPEASFCGAVLDSREVSGGELFFALPGERTDGHHFVGQALAAGAAGAVVSAPTAVACAPAQALILVRDTRSALHALTRAARRTLPRRALIGITGSAGKTTTKEFLVALLRPRFRVAGSPGNRNSLLGFPLALLGLPADCDWMVAEMAMSLPGELAELSLLARPDVAVFTNVRPVHLESFDRAGQAAPLRAIAQAKAGLLEGHISGGAIVANAADPEVRWLVERHRRERDPQARVFWYAAEGAPAREPSGSAREPSGSALEPGVSPLEPGQLALAAVEAVALASGGTEFTLWAPPTGERVRVVLPLIGAVNVANFLAAATCAHALGTPLAEMPDVARGLEAQPGRGRLLHLARGARLIDDSYNANPDATREALLAARALPAERLWCVLGEMRELGLAGPEHHRTIGRLAAELGYSPVVGVGELARGLVEAAAGAETSWFASAEAAAAQVPALVRAGDLVLVKGSRGVALERVVRAFLYAGGEDP